MAFLSSKLLQDLQTAVANVQSAYSVQAGEQQLRQLRLRFDYELCLATFMERSKRVNDRLLVALQLQKLLIMSEEQTVFILKNRYYQDVEQIAGIVRRMMTNLHNLKWVGCFLELDLNQLGCLESTRYIQFTFALFSHKNREAFISVLDLHFQIICQTFHQLLGVVSESENELLMLMVTISQFYQSALECDKERYSSQVCIVWRRAAERCRFYQTGLISSLRQVIDEYLFNRRAEFQPGTTCDIILGILKSSVTNNKQKLKYEGYYLQFISLHSDLFSSNQPVFQFINAFNMHAYEQNQSAIWQLGMGVTHLFGSQDEDEGEEQRVASLTLKSLIKIIFCEHYRSVAQEYNRQPITGKPLFIYLTPIVNYCNSPEHPLISKWVTDHIQEIVNCMGSFASSIQLTGCNQDSLSDFLSCLELLIKYKQLIDIKLLPHICRLLQEISSNKSTLTNICYIFLEQVWEQLASLDFNGVTDFLLKHLQELNGNQWDHQTNHYSCFLNLTQHVEDAYQICSINFMKDDELMIEIIKALQMVTELIKVDEGEGEKEGDDLGSVDLNMAVKVINLTSSFLIGENKEEQFFLIFRGGSPSLTFLARVITRFQLQGVECDRITACFNKMEKQRQQYNKGHLC